MKQVIQGYITTIKDLIQESTQHYIVNKIKEKIL